jgi:hypothetical protein
VNAGMRRYSVVAERTKMSMIRLSLHNNNRKTTEREHLQGNIEYNNEYGDSSVVGPYNSVAVEPLLTPRVPSLY